MDAIQRDASPSMDGRSPASAFPGRRYNRAWERRRWDHRRVLDHVAGSAVVRRVDRSGDVSVCHRHRAGQVYVMIDPVRVPWVFDRHGHRLRAQPAEELHAPRIRTRTVANRGGTRRGNIRCW